MSSSNKRKLTVRSIVRNTLVTLLIAFPSGGIELGQRGHEIVRPAPIAIHLDRPVQQKAWTHHQIDQLAPQTQLASLADVAGKHGPACPNASESFDSLVGAVHELRQRHLLLPLRNLRTENLRDSFSDSRGHRIHGAIDILAPRHTPILAVENGSIARLWFSVPGGITIYHFDPEHEYEYYYAHLESYAHGLKEGDQVQRGQVIGYVGTSGNAPKSTPHLHFSIYKLTKSKHWWDGTAVNPYLIFK